jgi:hypothetical protein
MQATAASITAKLLIAEYGDDAYQKCSDMIIEYACGNSAQPSDLSDVAEELKRRGYR